MSKENNKKEKELIEKAISEMDQFPNQQINGFIAKDKETFDIELEKLSIQDERTGKTNVGFKIALKGMKLTQIKQIVEAINLITE